MRHNFRITSNMCQLCTIQLAKWTVVNLAKSLASEYFIKSNKVLEHNLSWNLRTIAMNTRMSFNTITWHFNLRAINCNSAVIIIFLTTSHKTAYNGLVGSFHFMQQIKSFTTKLSAWKVVRIFLNSRWYLKYYRPKLYA